LIRFPRRSRSGSFATRAESETPLTSRGERDGAEPGAAILKAEDVFEDLARYYDPIMGHVDYDRWFMVASRVASMLPQGFRHLDAACGTGTLLKMLRRLQWNSFGVDLSCAMLRAGRRGSTRCSAAAGDLRALPFKESFQYITCLFDSMNFLLTIDDFERAIRQFHDALVPEGILYFDVVTERMVFDYYDGESWEEDNGRFSTRWENDYDRNARVITSAIRVNTGPSCRLRERIYEREDIERALAKAGFGLLGVYDAHSWKSPTRKTVRMDFVAVKGNPSRLRQRFRAVRRFISERLSE